MKKADFLSARADPEQGCERFAIGETGFSFDRAQRPATTLTSWLTGPAIPEAARDVLERHDHFDGVEGLLRIVMESDRASGVHAEWILARCTSGLISMIVRDAHTCRPEQLVDDAAFAVAQAKRYCASAAIVLAQEDDSTSTQASCTALQKAFATARVQPDTLYCSDAGSGTPVWFASLSSTL